MHHTPLGGFRTSYLLLKLASLYSSYNPGWPASNLASPPVLAKLALFFPPVVLPSRQVDLHVCSCRGSPLLFCSRRVGYSQFSGLGDLKIYIGIRAVPFCELFFTQLFHRYFSFTTHRWSMIPILLSSPVRYHNSRSCHILATRSLTHEKL